MSATIELDEQRRTALAKFARRRKLPCVAYSNELSTAYERKGERERAREEYERFLQVWKDADQDLPEVIAARQSLNASS